MKIFRSISGTILILLLLYAATQAVQDCTTGLFRYENCLWLWVRDFLGLPPGKLGRALTLESVGLALLVGFYATCRYVLPCGGSFRRPPPDASAKAAAEGPAPASPNPEKAAGGQRHEPGA